VVAALAVIILIFPLIGPAVNIISTATSLIVLVPVPATPFALILIRLFVMTVLVPNAEPLTVVPAGLPVLPTTRSASASTPILILPPVLSPTVNLIPII